MVITATIAACVAVLLYLYRKRRLQLLQRLGIPVVDSPNLVFGSLLDFRNHTLRTRLQSWTSQYGKTYGYYEGPTPNIVSSDLDFLQEVFVKQFGAFNGRKLYPLQTEPDKEKHTHMFFAHNERWKRLRKAANPAFSTAKMKQMFPTVCSDIDRFMKNVGSESSGFDIYDFYQRLTLDVIFECAFGVHINAQENPQSIYLAKLRDAFGRPKIPIILIIGLVFHELRAFLRTMYGMFLHLGIMKNAFFDVTFFLVPKIVRLRCETQRNCTEQQQQQQKDLIQLMLDLHNDEQNKESKSGKSEREISLPEIEAQVSLFMLAGYETSSTTLAYCSYLLATHPEVQRRLQKEIDELHESVAAERGVSAASVEVTYEDVCSNKLQFLEMVINETLRMYPIAANVFNRTCMYDTEVRGLRVPRGVNIVPEVWSIHYDPETWGPEDPNKFCPDRFHPDIHKNRHPLSFLSFGAGPRTCIGMRFAMMEIKTTMVRLLRQYNICECDRTEKPLQLHEMDVITPKNGVYVRLEKRSIIGAQ